MSIERTAPAGWAIVKLEDIVDILDSKRVPINSKERQTRVGQVPYYGATGQVGWIDDYLFDDELVLLGEDGAPFLDTAKQKAYLIRGKSWVNNHAHVLKARRDIPNAYIKYYLDSVDYHEFVTGTTRLKLNQAAMRRIPVPLAPPEQRNRIVAEIEKQFSRLDEAVANLNRVKANLKRYKASVLKAAVEGRLVGTEAELARQDGHDYESGVGLLARLLKERAGTWSGRGKYREPVPPQQNARQIVPEGWAISSLEQLTAPDRPCGYGVLQPGEDVSSGVPFVRVGDIGDGRVCLESLKKISPSIAARYPRTQLEGGEVLITLVGAIGRTAIVPKTLNGANVARAVAVIPIAQDVNARWVELWLRSPDRATELNQAAHEVARKTLNLEDVRRMNIAIPPLPEQRRIIEAAERALSVAIKQENAIEITMRRVERLRAAVLSVAFNHSRPMR